MAERKCFLRISLPYPNFDRRHVGDAEFCRAQAAEIFVRDGVRSPFFLSGERICVWKDSATEADFVTIPCLA